MISSETVRFPRLRQLFNLDTWGYGLFWLWNVIFLAFMVLGFAPQLLPMMLDAVRARQFPVEFLGYALLITVIPLLAVILGATRLRQQPRKLLALGYGVEGPLLLLLLLRFFIIRQATPAVITMLAMVSVGLAALLWWLLSRRAKPLRTFGAAVQLIGLSLLLLAGLYAALWLLFYALPVGAILWDGIKHFVGDFFAIIGNVWDALTSAQWWRQLGINLLLIPFNVLGVILLAFSATLFVGMPVAIVLIYGRAWLHALHQAGARMGYPAALGLSLLVMAVGVVAVTALDRQPQARSFTLLEIPPATPAEAQTLLAQQEQIRYGLLNAYLAPQRYISSAGEVRHIKDLYMGAPMNLGEAGAKRVQRAYERIAAPLLYRPVEASVDDDWRHSAFLREPAQAAALYEQFFDQPITDGERDAVVTAVRSSWNIETSNTAWLAVDDREVYLLAQAITVTAQADWADVELAEVYQNMTGINQEVVYYFSLPETAVITGLWLGNSADRSQRFAYRISPRGAAQTAYRNEVRRRVDPALVEQIGPRQYRLRAFPIPPQRIEWQNNNGLGRTTLTPGEPLYLWLTYRVLAQQGSWPLPQLAEKVNVYWDQSTVRTLNGQSMPFGDADPAAVWLPAVAPLADAATAAPQMHVVDFPGGQTVIARPSDGSGAMGLAGDLRLAVVLDRSRSMAAQAAAVETSFGRLRTLAEGGAQVDVYLTASPYRGEAPSLARLADFDPASVLYFGGQNAAELLAQFAALRADRAYDAVLVLTDGSGYETGATDVPVAYPDAALWLVHLGGLPMGYDDPTLDALQASGGGAATSVDEALGRLAVALAAPAEGVSVDVVDGYQWLVLPTAQARALNSTGDATPDAAAFAPLAARRLILSEMQAARGQLDDLTLLDRLHALAANYGLVTPLSSMIVLVEERQQALLDKLEQQDDRFQREHEDVGETAETPVVAAVPEPEEWLLLGLAAALLVWLARRRYQPASSLV
ncbi:MAG: TIGR02921 family PEP-CTERM protein [Caldilineales bacterium]|mgnify:CR=1 FL=1